ANKDVEVGEAANREDARERMRGNKPLRWRQFQPRLEPRRERVLAVHTEPEARQRDAELRRRDEAILPRGRREQPEDAPREAVAQVRSMLDRRPRHADDRELGGDEERVRQKQREDDERDGHDPPAPASRNAFSASWMLTNPRITPLSSTTPA